VLSDRLGHDLSSYPLDGPVPTLPPSTIMQGHAVTLSALARKHNMTLRELRDFTAAAMGHRLLCGTPEFVADGLEEWFVAGAADGFNLMPPWFPGAFDDFVDQVVPILQRRGLFRTEYTGRTLRDHLGLPRPAHPRSTHDASGAGRDGMAHRASA
jgi:alkanesulfonate monooxygenase SsuD/methylene tetrahydromethanopterin reductase-like flavin-dependent oxidoreductase (luciferase family)